MSTEQLKKDLQDAIDAAMEKHRALPEADALYSALDVLEMICEGYQMRLSELVEDDE